MSRKLPCFGCKAECCGAVPVREGELRRIMDVVRGWEDGEVGRMAAQEREPLTCPFVDTDSWRCSVYQARPTICRLFGRSPGLECPHEPKAAREVPKAVAVRMLEKDERLGPTVGVLGFDLGWDELRKMLGSEIAVLKP